MTWPPRAHRASFFSRDRPRELRLLRCPPLGSSRSSVQALRKGQGPRTCIVGPMGLAPRCSCPRGWAVRALWRTQGTAAGGAALRPPPHRAARPQVGSRGLRRRLAPEPPFHPRALPRCLRRFGSGREPRRLVGFPAAGGKKAGLRRGRVNELSRRSAESEFRFGENHQTATTTFSKEPGAPSFGPGPPTVTG